MDLNELTRASSYERDQTDLGRGQLQLWQYKDAFRSGEDAVALAHFSESAWRRHCGARQRDPKEILDLGCASGMVLTLLLDSFPTSLGFGVEMIARQAELARINMQENALQNRTKILQEDIRLYQSKPWPWGRVELIVCNPPYREGLPRGGFAGPGSGAKSEAGDQTAAPESGDQTAAWRYERQVARFDFAMNMADLAHLANLALDDEGCLCLVFPLARQTYLLREMAKQKLFLKHWCRLCSSPLHAPKQGLYCLTYWTGAESFQDEDWHLR